MKPDIDILDDLQPIKTPTVIPDEIDECIDNFINKTFDFSVQLECDNNGVVDVKEKIEYVLESFRFIDSVHVFSQADSLIILIGINHRKIGADTANRICHRLSTSLNNCLKSKIIANSYTYIKLYKGNCLQSDVKPIYQDVMISETPLSIDKLTHILRTIIF